MSRTRVLNLKWLAKAAVNVLFVHFLRKILYLIFDENLSFKKDLFLDLWQCFLYYLLQFHSSNEFIHKE